MTCRFCECTDDEACNPPCSWAAENVCSTCQEALEALETWLESCVKPHLFLLIREAAKMANDPLVLYNDPVEVLLRD